MNLKQRSSEIEIMDDLDISGEVIGQTLKELDFINQILGGNAISLSLFKKLLKNHDIHSVADLGCGSGDILVKMAQIASRANQQIQFTGVDANPHIVDYAQEHVRKQENIQIANMDIFSEAFQQQSFDVIHCCLFLHHFTEVQLVGLFQSFRKQARKAIIINDLHRHFLAFHSIKWLTAVLSKSFMVRNDAAVSVARGFKRKELVSILQQAGIEKFELKWKWAFRWQLIVFND